MKNKTLYLWAVLLLFLTIANACRNDINLNEHSHQHHSSAKFVSFKKFQEVTKIPSKTFFLQTLNNRITNKNQDFNDFDIDTTQIRQTLRNNQIEAFSFHVYPKADSLSNVNNVFYNLAYIKQTDNSWNRFIVKYTSIDNNYLINLQNNPTLKFQGTSEVLTSENSSSRQIGLCSFTSDVEMWNCPYGHTKIQDCLEGTLGYNCCYGHGCVSFNTVTVIKECSDGSSGGGTPPTDDPPQGGGSDGNGSEFDVNLPEPDTRTTCEILNDNSNNPEFQGKIDSLQYLVSPNNPEQNDYETQITVRKKGSGFKYSASNKKANFTAGTVGVLGVGTNYDIATIHNHPPNTIPIFSAGDIVSFYKKYKFVIPPLKNAFTYYVTNPNGTVYALRMNNISALDTLFAGLDLNIREQRELAELKIKKIFESDGKMNTNINYNSDMAEKMFLKTLQSSLFGSGNAMSIYQQIDDQWKKLSLNQNETISKTPCP